MSALHDAARRVVSAWVSTRPAWIEQCNAAVLALDAALKAQPEPAGCETEADCTSQPWCRIRGACQRKQPEPAQEAEPYAWHYTNNAGASVWHRGPSTRLDADMQAARDYPRVHKVTPLYTASQPQPEPAQEPVAVFDERMGQPVLLSGAPMLKDEQPLYTAPPQQPEPAQEPAACIRTWHKDGEQHAELRVWEDGIDGLPDGEHLLYTAAPKPAQEPVAKVRWNDIGHISWRTQVMLPDNTPLYTASQPQRPPLTNEEINRLWHDNGAGIDAERFVRIARAVERKVRGE